jgi:hypothetical protein
MPLQDNPGPQSVLQRVTNDSGGNIHTNAEPIQAPRGVSLILGW